MAHRYDDTAFYRWHRENLPLRVGDSWYGRTRPPFSAVNILTHLANLPRPLTEHNKVLFMDLSGRYPHKWAEVDRQVRRPGGPSLNLAPIARIEWVLRHCVGGGLWVQVQKLVQGYLARKLVQHLRLWQCQVHCRLNGVFVLGVCPRRLVFIHTPISNRSLCIIRPWERVHQKRIPQKRVPQESTRKLN